jgi:23S rRNA pseudouridine1911/1915/1917 synthase
MPGLEPAQEPACEGSAFALGDSEAGTRLDRFLASALELSRARVRDLLASGAVSLEGRPLGYGDKGLSLPGSGTLRVARRTPASEARARPGEAVPELARGASWVVVDKPAGMPVHPLSEDQTATVLNALIARHPEMHGVGEGGLRSGVVHRLDVDTSGVLLFATAEDAWQRLRDAFRTHRVDKRYRALVSGAFPDRLAGAMECELAVARHRPARVRVVDETWSQPRRAWPVRQHVTIVERLDGATLLEVRIETGFLHQIRATLAHQGHPILGDALYASSGALAPGVGRQMLHAASLRFDEIDTESKDPEDFASLLASLRRKAAEEAT